MPENVEIRLRLLDEFSAMLKKYNVELKQVETQGTQAAGKISDDFKKMGSAAKQAQGFAGDFRAELFALVGWAGVAAAVVGAFKKMATAAAEAEAASVKLRSTLAVAGFEDQADSVEAWAQTMLAAKGVNDELSASLVANAVAKGVSVQRAKELVSASADLAVITGNLAGTFEELTRASDGDQRAMQTIARQFNITYQAGMTFSELLAELKKRTEGLANVNLQTAIGQWKLFFDNVGNMAERWGQHMLDVFKPVFRELNEGFAGWQEKFAALKDLPSEELEFRRAELQMQQRGAGGMGVAGSGYTGRLEEIVRISEELRRRRLEQMGTAQEQAVRGPFYEAEGRSVGDAEAFTRLMKWRQIQQKQREEEMKRLEQEAAQQSLVVAQASVEAAETAWESFDPRGIEAADKAFKQIEDSGLSRAEQRIKAELGFRLDALKEEKRMRDEAMDQHMAEAQKEIEENAQALRDYWAYDQKELAKSAEIKARLIDDEFRLRQYGVDTDLQSKQNYFFMQNQQQAADMLNELVQKHGTNLEKWDAETLRQLDFIVKFGEANGISRERLLKNVDALKANTIAQFQAAQTAYMFGQALISTMNAFRSGNIGGGISGIGSMLMMGAPLLKAGGPLMFGIGAGMTLAGGLIGSNEPRTEGGKARKEARGILEEYGIPVRTMPEAEFYATGQADMWSAWAKMLTGSERAGGVAQMLAGSFKDLDLSTRETSEAMALMYAQTEGINYMAAQQEAAWAALASTAALTDDELRDLVDSYREARDWQEAYNRALKKLRDDLDRGAGLEQIKKDRAELAGLMAQQEQARAQAEKELKDALKEQGMSDADAQSLIDKNKSVADNTATMVGLLRSIDAKIGGTGTVISPHQGAWPMYHHGKMVNGYPSHAAWIRDDEAVVPPEKRLTYAANVLGAITGGFQPSITVNVSGVVGDTRAVSREIHRGLEKARARREI